MRRFCRSLSNRMPFHDLTYDYLIHIRFRWVPEIIGRSAGATNVCLNSETRLASFTRFVASCRRNCCVLWSNRLPSLSSFWFAALTMTSGCVTSRVYRYKVLFQVFLRAHTAEEAWGRAHHGRGFSIKGVLSVRPRSPLNCVFQDTWV